MQSSLGCWGEQVGLGSSCRPLECSAFTSESECFGKPGPRIIGSSFCDFDGRCISRSLSTVTCSEIKMQELCDGYSINVTANETLCRWNSGGCYQYGCGNLTDCNSLLQVGGRVCEISNESCVPLPWHSNCGAIRTLSKCSAEAGKYFVSGYECHVIQNQCVPAMCAGLKKETCVMSQQNSTAYSQPVSVWRLVAGRRTQELCDFVQEQCVALPVNAPCERVQSQELCVSKNCTWSGKCQIRTCGDLNNESCFNEAKYAFGGGVGGLACVWNETRTDKPCEKVEEGQCQQLAIQEYCVLAAWCWWNNGQCQIKNCENLVRACECLASRNPLCYFRYDSQGVGIGKCVDRTECEQAWDTSSCRETSSDCEWIESRGRCETKTCDMRYTNQSCALVGRCVWGKDRKCRDIVDLTDGDACLDQVNFNTLYGKKKLRERVCLARGCFYNTTSNLCFPNIVELCTSLITERACGFNRKEPCIWDSRLLRCKRAPEEVRIQTLETTGNGSIPGNQEVDSWAFLARVGIIWLTWV